MPRASKCKAQGQGQRRPAAARAHAAGTWQAEGAQAALVCPTYLTGTGERSDRRTQLTSSQCQRPESWPPQHACPTPPPPLPGGWHDCAPAAAKPPSTPNPASSWSTSPGLATPALSRSGPPAGKKTRTLELVSSSRQRDCHFAGTPSSSLLKGLINESGVQQNDSLADGQSAAAAAAALRALLLGGCGGVR